MELEDVFSSRMRVKILKLIFKFGQLNVSEIARRVNSNYSSTAGHLKVLESEGVLKVYLYGRVRLYSFNSGSQKSKVVQALIDVWEQSGRSGY
ncbi:MAG: winged helix-turn-helix domain-containing protein [Candidatus Bathyarchaeota archaeon]|nr:winged helix-turn-helix domain-containing protein [Candidatus Termiticorpusculum sp.]